MIRLDKLSKKFGQNYVVKQACAEFVRSKVTAIIGPNGAGKSTVLSMAGRLLTPDAGEVWIDSRALVDWNTRELAQHLSVLRQANSFTMRFTVKELVAFGRFPYSRGKLTVEDHNIIDQALEYLDLTGLQDKYLDELSGGQRQLAFIAMVIAQDTDYIFLDEPLNNLDIKHSLQIMHIIQKLAHELGKMVVIVIHDINFAACYADNIIALKNGEIIAQGDANSVIQADILEQIYETPFRIIEVEGKRMCLYHS